MTLAIGTIFLSAVARAALIDDYGGTPGQPLTHWDNAEFLYQDDALSYPGIPASGGSARVEHFRGSGGNATVTGSYTGVLPGGVSEGRDALYLSFLISADSLDDFSDASGAGVQFNVHRNMWGGIFRDGETLRVGGGYWTIGDSFSVSQEYTPGETVFMVAKVENMVFSGWGTPNFAWAINPDLSEEPDWQFVSMGGNTQNGVDPGSLDLFVRAATEAGGWNDDKFGAVNIDQVRIGETWDAVAVPEPGVLLLLVLGGGVCAAFLRRRR